MHCRWAAGRTAMQAALLYAFYSPTCYGATRHYMLGRWRVLCIASGRPGALQCKQPCSMPCTHPRAMGLLGVACLAGGRVLCIAGGRAGALQCKQPAGGRRAMQGARYYRKPRTAPIRLLCLSAGRALCIASGCSGGRTACLNSHALCLALTHVLWTIRHLSLIHI